MHALKQAGKKRNYISFFLCMYAQVSNFITTNQLLHLHIINTATVFYNIVL